MPIPILTISEYTTQLKSAIKARNINYDVDYGPIPDLMITPVAALSESQNARLRQLESLLKLLNDGSYARADLEAFVLNAGVVPDQGTPAIVVLTFSVTRNPSSSITVNAGFPVGTLTDETTGDFLTFVTLQSATLPAYPAAMSYFNATTQAFELNILARCTTSGAVGLVAAGKVTSPLKPLANFDKVFNAAPSSGGRDPSQDGDLIEQYLIAITGSNLSTPDGIVRTTRDLFSGALDYVPVYGPDITRAATDAGAVDLFIMGSQPAPFPELQTFVGLGQPIVMLQQPTISVLSVVKVAGSISYTAGVDYFYVKDTGIYSGSVNGADYIIFNGTGASPNPGDSIQITYSQNQLISSIQSTYTAPNRNVLGRNLLVRAATPVPIAITVAITARAGFSLTTLQSQAYNNILNWVNSLLLGARVQNESVGGAVQQSDIDLAIRQSTGIDNVVFTRLCTVAGPSGVGDIPIGKSQYPTIDSTDPTVLVVTASY